MSAGSGRLIALNCGPNAETHILSGQTTSYHSNDLKVQPLTYVSNPLIVISHGQVQLVTTCTVLIIEEILKVF